MWHNMRGEHEKSHEWGGLDDPAAAVLGLRSFADDDVGDDDVGDDEVGWGLAVRAVDQGLGHTALRWIGWAARLPPSQTGAVAYRLAMQVPPLDGPPVRESDPRKLLLGYLDWYRETALRKIDGLSGEQLRTPVAPLGWAPLGIVRHLGWAERRWMRWGFAAEDVAPHPPGGREAEFTVDPGEDPATLLDEYRGEIERAAALMSAAALTDRARVGGRFKTAEQAPSLSRILFHLLQEYARHVGHLDIARELIDGVTRE